MDVEGLGWGTSASDSTDSGAKGTRVPGDPLPCDSWVSVGGGRCSVGLEQVRCYFVGCLNIWVGKMYCGSAHLFPDQGLQRLVDPCRPLRPSPNQFSHALFQATRQVGG